MSRKTNRQRRSSRLFSAGFDALESRQLFAAAIYPASKLIAAAPTANSVTYTFNVQYSSSVGVRESTLDSNDIIVSGPNDFERGAVFVGASGTANAMTAKYKVSTPGGFWDAADNGAYTVRLNKGQVRDIANNPTRLKTLGTFEVDLAAATTPTPVTTTKTTTPGPIATPIDSQGEPVVGQTTTAGATANQGGVNVASFGAIPNDGIDDTDAIQRAIDSLPQGAGVPDSITKQGGYVTLASGTYTLSKALKLRNIVGLRGQGSSTILNNISTDKTSTAILLYSPYSHGSNIQSSVQNLQIKTAAARGIQVDPKLAGDLISLRLEGLTISSGNTAIDLRGEDVYQATIKDITVVDPGSSALYMTIGHANSALNRVENFKITGAARSGFTSTDALVTLGGDVTGDGISIADIGASVTPIAFVGASGSINGLSVATATAKLKSGYVATIDQSTIGIASMAGVDKTRKLRVTNSAAVRVDSVAVNSGSTLADALSIDTASHVSVASAVASSSGALDAARVAVKAISAVAGAAATTATTGGATTITGPTSSAVVSATQFGAKADDNLDDTAAIQSAVDSLSNGGLVTLPQGVFNTSAPIKVPSGVWIQGQYTGTVIKNTSGKSTDSIFKLVGNAQGNNDGAGIVGLAMNSTVAAGITADSSITSSLSDLRLRELNISAGGVGVDLRSVKTYHARLETVVIRDPGSAGVWIGDAAGLSADNYLVGVQLTGKNRAGFKADGGQVVVRGQTTLENCWLELNGGAWTTPLVASGDVTLRGNWIEYSTESLPNKVMINFSNTTRVEADRILLADADHKIMFRNAQNVHIGYLNIAGQMVSLSGVLDMDAGSHAHIDNVYTIMDSGMLDDSRLQIDGVYSSRAKKFVDTNLAMTGTNLIADPNFTDLSKWNIGFGGAQGTVTVEQTANGPRLKITITSNPKKVKVGITPKLSIPAGATGKANLGAWKIEGAAGFEVYNENFKGQYVGRAIGSETAAYSPGTINSGTQMIMLLPPTTGTWYLSNVRFVAVG